jgi:cleavage stimulation factor subunit 3
MFLGPVFRTDDLMMLLRNAVIPSATRSRTPPPASPVRGGNVLFFLHKIIVFDSPQLGRPPPDYGPYQGPGGRPGRRY